MSKLASSILVFLRHNEQEHDMKQIIGDGKTVWFGYNSLEWIGKGNEEWDSVFLIVYKNHSKYQQAIERFRLEDFKQIRVFAVKPVPRYRIRILRFLMKHIFSRSSVSFSKEDRNLDDIPKNNILPSKEQHIRVAKGHNEHAIVMVNLLKFYEQSSYPLEYEGKKSGTGEEAYSRYGQVAIRAVAKLGGILEHIGEVDGTLIGEQDEDWNQFALMQYPSLTALESMFKIEEIPEAGIERDAGLKVTRVYATTPRKKS